MIKNEPSRHFPSLCKHHLRLMNEYSCLIQTLVLNKGRESLKRQTAPPLIHRQITFIHPEWQCLCVWWCFMWCIADVHKRQNFIFLWTSICTCETVWDSGVKDTEGGSDHILTAVPADAASCYWNLAGDLKLFTHFPLNPPVLVEHARVWVCVNKGWVGVLWASQR